MAKPQVEIDGLKALQREIRKTKDTDLIAALKKTNVDVANIVLPGSKSKSPKRSGSLAGSLRVTNTAGYAAIRAGSAKAVPYAGVIHFGWPARGIEAQPFITDEISDKYRTIVKSYEAAIEELGRRLTS